MRDGIELARLGIPGALILPAGLVSLAREKARFLGIPDYPIAILPISLYGHTNEEIADAAAIAFLEVIGFLHHD